MQQPKNKEKKCSCAIPKDVEAKKKEMKRERPARHLDTRGRGNGVQDRALNTTGKEQKREQNPAPEDKSTKKSELGGGDENPGS